MNQPNKKQLLRKIEQLRKDKMELFVWMGIFAVLALVMLVIIAKNTNNGQENLDNICLPKYSGFFTAVDGTHSVAIFDMLNKDQAQLASEVNQIINRLNSIQLKGGVN